jgi:hypothetical protein
MEEGLVLSPRLTRELEALRKGFEGLAFGQVGQWILLPRYPYPDNWSEREAPVTFQVPAGYPGSPPYGFYVSAGLRFNGEIPKWQHPATNNPPFDGDWAFFSWAIDGNWAVPTTSAIGGCNLRTFVDSFAQRLAEGI